MAPNAGQIRTSHVKSRFAQPKELSGETLVANIKSQIKRNKQNEKKRISNRTYRGAARTAVKAAKAALIPGAESPAILKDAISALDKAAEKGVIHAKNASRRKSRLMKAANKAAKAPAVEATTKTKKK